MAELEVRLQQEHALAARAPAAAGADGSEVAAGAADARGGSDRGQPGSGLRTVTIDSGSADGVPADMAVIAPEGVVGRIIGPVAQHAARVQLLIDRNAAAGAMTERTRAGGMVIGVEANPPLRMELVSNLADIKAGRRHRRVRRRRDLSRRDI